jgi:hypothetical protein
MSQPHEMVSLRMITLVASLVLATPSPTPEPSPYYVQFCSGAQSYTGAQIEALQAAQRNSFPIQSDDASIVASMTREIRSADIPATRGFTLISLAAREFGILTGHGPYAPDEAILFRVETGKGVVHVLGTFDQSGRVKDVRLATTSESALALGFGRFMAAYMLFNDLTASDAGIPRKGCESVFREQFFTLPEVLPELLYAIREEPAQDPALIKLVRKSYADFSAIAKAASGDYAPIARKTLQLIGASPTITVVYRDRARALGTASEFDVVRLDGDKRAYAMFSVDNDGKSALGPTPSCVVGDTSCARFYAWP